MLTLVDINVVDEDVVILALYIVDNISSSVDKKSVDLCIVNDHNVTYYGKLPMWTFVRLTYVFLQKCSILATHPYCQIQHHCVLLVT